MKVLAIPGGRQGDLTETLRVAGYPNAATSRRWNPIQREERSCRQLSRIHRDECRVLPPSESSVELPRNSAVGEKEWPARLGVSVLILLSQNHCCISRFNEIE